MKETLENKCINYKSIRIKKDDKRWYTACHKLCNGYQTTCERYYLRSKYFQEKGRKK